MTVQISSRCCLLVWGLLALQVVSATGFVMPFTTLVPLQQQLQHHQVSTRQTRTTKLYQSTVAPAIPYNNMGRNDTSSFIASATTVVVQPLLSPKKKQSPPNEAAPAVAKTEASTKPFYQRVEGVVFFAYLCNIMALSLPILLVPIAVREYLSLATVSAGAIGSSSAQLASAVAAISSIATLGGASGKFVNGFVCQGLGSRESSRFYFLGLGLASLVFSLSTNPSQMAAAIFGMEFFASIHWVSLTVLLSSKYASQPKRLAAALTTLGLSSTIGQVIVKFVGSYLASACHWRTVARVGAGLAVVGSAIIARAPSPQKEASEHQAPAFSWNSVRQSLKNVLTNKLFWILAVAHSMALGARGTERILGTFFQVIGDVPAALAGGLTLSVTVGLILGLVTGTKQLSTQPTVSHKLRFLSRRYATSVAATLGLAGVAQWGPALLPSAALRTALTALLSTTLIANIALQYFSFPALIGKSSFFQKDKAVVISFLDGFGYLLSAPVFAACSQLVPTRGWASAWGLLATLFGASAVLLLKNIGVIFQDEQDMLERQQREQDQQARAALPVPPL